MAQSPDEIAAFLNSPPAVDVGALLNFYADKYGLDRDLVRRVARQESGFNPKARSNKGAIGVMQLMPETAAALGVNPRDPEQNVEGGIRYLKQQMDEFGNTRLVDESSQDEFALPR